VFVYSIALTNCKQDKRLSVGILVGIVFVALAVMSSPIVLAASPHFVGTPQITKNPNSSLTANFKANGLANIISAAFLTSSGGSATLQCVNPSGNSLSPKQVTFGPLKGQITFIQPRNSQVSATTFSIGPPSIPSSSQICPNFNWNVVLLSFIYDNVVLHIRQKSADILTFNFNFGNVDP
jgi:hypothetical protein